MSFKNLARRRSRVGSIIILAIMGKIQHLLA